MTLTIEVLNEQAAMLATKARARGLSVEQYASQLLEQDLQSSRSATRHISEVILERMRKVPPKIMADMPVDGASQHDHYIYGLPKREP